MNNKKTIADTYNRIYNLTAPTHTRITLQNTRVTIQIFNLRDSLSNFLDKMELFQAHMSKVRVPSTYDSVYKDECVYSFDTPVG